MAGKAEVNSQVKQAVDEVLKTIKYEPVQPSAVRTVEIELDKPRKLRMSLGAMKLIQDETGKNPLDTDAWQFRDVKETCTFLWACLRHEDPDLTLDQVMELDGVDLANFPYIVDRLSQLWGFSTPDPVPGEENKDPN